MTNDSNCNWRYVGKYKEGLAVVMDQNDKWGFIDETGTVAILCTWRGASENAWQRGGMIILCLVILIRQELSSFPANGQMRIISKKV